MAERDDIEALVDREARDRIRGSLDESLLVEAAAGTGKTTELVQRIVRVVATGRAAIDSIVAVTFTRKAAGELQLRLRQELDAARAATQDDDARRRLEEAIEHLEEAHVGTIHSFCIELLKERPIEAGIDPDFQPLSEDEAPRFFTQVFQSWIEARLAESRPVLERILARLAVEPSWDAAPLERIRDAAWQLAEWRDYPAPWSRTPFDREAAAAALLEEIDALAAISRRCESSGDYLKRALAPVEVFAAWRERAEAVDAADADLLEGRLCRLAVALRRNRWKGRGPFAPGVSRSEVIDRRDRLITELDAYQAAVEADLAPLLREELAGLLDAYQEAKRLRGRLDFTDLLLLTRDLLRDNGQVRAHFQRRLTHLFVDEFQDTDPLQIEILLLLAAEESDTTDWRALTPRPGSLFLVGDPKQSIYRFRRADVRLYQEVKERLIGAGVALVELRQSFRAVPTLQRAINAAFGVTMDGNREEGQARYIALDPYRDDHPSQPHLVALPVAEPYGRWGDRPFHNAIEESLPLDVAGFIEWLLRSSGWTVEDPAGGGRVPIAPSHICILFRRYMKWRQDVTRDYTRQLEQRDIPHVLLGARTFHQREEVETLRAALTAVEWPDDDLAVYATLRGSLFAIPDDALLRFASEHVLHPFLPREQRDAARADDQLRPVVEVLDLLADLHRWRNRRPVAETLHRLLEASRAWAAFLMRPAGHQVLANVSHLGDLARTFEMSGGLSFRAFVERLRAEAERSAASAGPIVEEAAEGVRLMTVHTAKGLEFPVVILADMTAALSRDRPDKHVDPEVGLCAMEILRCSPQELLDQAEAEAARDRTEGVRIAYVAATRARDLLVVPAIGDGEHEGWLSPLHPAIYPAVGERRGGSVVEGLPLFGDRSVLVRNERFDGREEESVRPGRHDLGGHAVVWWDPDRLEREVEESYGLADVDVLGTEEDEVAADQGMERYETWKRDRAQRVAAGRVPGHRVRVVTELEEGPAESPGPIVVEALERASLRPSGRRFGTLVHTVLRDVPLDAKTPAIEATARLQGLLLHAAEEEVAAAVSAVAAALDHPRLRAARAASRLLRESPFVLPLSDGTLLEGTLDLAYEEEAGEWTVVDFKTDFDLAAGREGYETQLAWYMYALRRTTGSSSVRGVLLAI